MDHLSIHFFEIIDLSATWISSVFSLTLKVKSQALLMMH